MQEEERDNRNQEKLIVSELSLGRVNNRNSSEFRKRFHGLNQQGLQLSLGNRPSRTLAYLKAKSVWAQTEEGIFIHRPKDLKRP